MLLDGWTYAYSLIKVRRLNQNADATTAGLWQRIDADSRRASATREELAKRHLKHANASRQRLIHADLCW